MRALVMLAAVLFAGAAEAAMVNLTVDNLRRMYVVELPAGYVPGSVPILLWHHGGNKGSAQEAHDQHALHIAGENAIVVYPQACPMQRTNNCRTGEGGWQIGDDWGAADRDLRFAEAVLADVRSRYGATGAAYAGGGSRGCYFSYYLAQARDSFSRIACAHGALNARPQPAGVAEPLLHIHDPDDPLVCWDTWRLSCLTLPEVQQVELARDGYYRWLSWSPTSMLHLSQGVGHNFDPSYRAIIWNFLLRP